ncbi:MAG: LacI family DNA-binding transcriptional regulator [Opitutaceae bacterium]|nr:LacI family DNA-binding transcriptional regulator [Opitutaceae bacterium]
MSVRQIAQLAGLSPSAVSLALRDSPKIPAATRRRVLRLARRLGYRPNAKVNELMSQLRLNRVQETQACLGVISLYDDPQPWKKSLHLSRIHDHMVRRAEFFGYRLEPLWLREPGMTPRRFSDILDARGIQGLLCFGGPDLNQELPPELDHFAIVSQGLSIKTPMHRVMSHVYNDMWRALDQVYRLGYRRPGLVIGRYEDIRSAHAHFCVYLGWCQYTLGAPTAIPVLQLERVEEEPLMRWLGHHRPDVLVFVHYYDVLREFDAVLRRRRLRVPRDLGVVVMSQILEGTRFSGLQENQRLLGDWCVELLMARIMSRDFARPTHPRIEMVEREWIEGRTLRRQGKSTST